MGVYYMKLYNIQKIDLREHSKLYYLRSIPFYHHINMQIMLI